MNSGHYVIARTPTAGTPHTRAKSGKVEKNGENSGPPMLLPVDRLSGDQLQHRWLCQNNSYFGKQKIKSFKTLKNQIDPSPKQ